MQIFIEHFKYLLFVSFQPIDYEGFQLFMEILMESSLTEELCKTLFLSFMKKPVPQGANVGKEFHIRDVAAAMASQTLCAPITHQTADIHLEKPEKHHGLAEKLHGLTEKLHGLGHHGGEKGHSRHDSSGTDAGRRSRAGRCQPRHQTNCLSYEERTKPSLYTYLISG